MPLTSGAFYSIIGGNLACNERLNSILLFIPSSRKLSEFNCCYFMVNLGRFVIDYDCEEQDRNETILCERKFC